MYYVSQSRSEEVLMPHELNFLLTMIDRERLLKDHMTDFYPRLEDPNFGRMLIGIGHKLAKIVHPTTVDAFLEQYPHLYEYFGVPIEAVTVYKQRADEEIAKRQDNPLDMDNLIDEINHQLNSEDETAN